MDKVLENVLGPLILKLIKTYVPDLVKSLEVELVSVLRAAAQDTSNALDDAAVDALAEALGIA